MIEFLKELTLGVVPVVTASVLSLLLTLGRVKRKKDVDKIAKNNKAIKTIKKSKAKRFLFWFYRNDEYIWCAFIFYAMFIGVYTLENKMHNFIYPKISVPLFLPSLVLCFVFAYLRTVSISYYERFQNEIENCPCCRANKNDENRM